MGGDIVGLIHVHLDQFGLTKFLRHLLKQGRNVTTGAAPDVHIYIYIYRKEGQGQEQEQDEYETRSTPNTNDTVTTLYTIDVPTGGEIDHDQFGFGQLDELLILGHTFNHAHHLVGFCYRCVCCVGVVVVVVVVVGCFYETLAWMGESWPLVFSLSRIGPIVPEQVCNTLQTWRRMRFPTAHRRTF